MNNYDAPKVPPNSVFKFKPDPNFVKVENIPKDVDKQEILALFNALIGDVRSAEEQKDARGVTYMQLSFYNRDAAKKALCMNGYTVSGTALLVTQIPTFDSQSMHSKQSDARRNLYVLGLPFALTKSEFAAIFSKYGTVAHCVILATVDNASRRRGFVVMSSHEEAKNAMANLSRTQIKGHTLDISWAVVQRSQGFLDGGDRAVFMADNAESRSPSMTSETEKEVPETVIVKEIDVIPPQLSLSSDLGALELSLTPTTTILVSNLPSVLFSQPADLRPLLCPFGTIKNLKLIPSPSEDNNANTPDSDAGTKEKTTTVLVEYHHPAEAEDAHRTLRGQSYAQFSLEVLFLRPTPPLVTDGYSARFSKPMIKHSATGPTPSPHTPYACVHSPATFVNSSAAFVNQSSSCMGGWHGGPGLFYNAPHYLFSPSREGPYNAAPPAMPFDYFRRMPVLPTLPTPGGQLVYPAFAPMPATYAGF